MKQMKQRRINLGCGNNYKEGWINVDFNKKVKADIYRDITQIPLFFKGNFADEILLDNVLEHIPHEKFFPFLEELHRICKDGAIIKIYVPHYSGMYSSKHLTHYKHFGVGTFDIMREEACFNAERYSTTRFKLIKERLLFFHHNLANFKFLSKLKINWLFNFSRAWKQLMERFNPFGFDEIYYELEVKKKKELERKRYLKKKK